MELTDEVRDTAMSYIGRERRLVDSMAPEPAAKLAVILDTGMPDLLPTTWHWAYFNAAVPAANVGHDGHERLGLFMPPAPFERRMWAAGDITVDRPLRLGEPATRVSTIADVAFKTGKTGALCFVEVRHDISQGGVAALTEVQTIVYRDRSLPERALREPHDPVPNGYRVFPDTQLIAYSSVTQNGHRIHWDRDFCRDVEGYPDLVVHGPLLATVLADALLPAPAPCRYTYRAKAPVFETSPVRVVTEGAAGKVERSDGVTALSGEITARP